MFHQNYWLKLVVSAMMALPAPSWAQSSPESTTQPATSTDGVPVAFIPVQKGEITVYAAVAPINEAQLEGVAFSSAQANPDGLNVLVSENVKADPVFRGVQKSGFLKRVKVFVASTAKLPGKLKQQVDKVTSFAKRERAGLMVSFIGATGFAGTLTYLGSSSVDSGLVILAGVLAWYSFLNTKTHFWEKILDYNERKADQFITEALQLVGVQASEEGKSYARATGSFAVSWAANWLMATFILVTAGQYESWAQAAFFGFLGNYNVWDGPILKKLKTNFAKMVYFAIQFSIAPVAEASMYSGSPAATWILGLTTLSGLLFLIHTHKVDLTARARALKEFFTVRSPVRKCELLLDNAGPAIWGDVQ